MNDLVFTTVVDGVLTLTLNRPEKRNALSLELIESLEAAVERAHREVDHGRARIVVLAGEGQTFCAGMDLEGVLSDAVAMGKMLHSLARIAVRIRALTCPTIARVQGGAIGGGCGLMVVTDFAFTHPEARIGYPEVSLGVTPAVVAPHLMRKIGPGRARAILLSSGTMTGTQAHEIGIADRLAPVAELTPAVDAFARQLAAGGREALTVTKRWLNELDASLDMNVAERAAAVSAEVIRGPEAQESLRRRFVK